MSQVSTLQSLDLILEDVSAEINLSINSLEQYAKNSKQQTQLKKSITHLSKLKGVFTLLDMKGAQQLSVDTIKLIKSLPKKKQATQHQLLETISFALARLMRYTEHVNQKPHDLPQLLLPAINSIRNSINAPLLQESEFFNYEHEKTRNNRKLVLITSEESASTSRHIRQMYQIGLIEVLRQTNLIGGLKMMQRAMQKLDDECPRPNTPNLWWIAQGLLDGFIENSLVLTKTRLKLFSRLDRQIRLVENKPATLLKDSKTESRQLEKEMLYLTLISGATSHKVSSLLSHFELKPTDISDSLLRQETKEMRGPRDKDYVSIAEALLDEINDIKDALTNSQENKFEPVNLKQIHKQMTNLNSLLRILQVDDQSIRLTVAIDLINNAISSKKPLSDKDTNILYIVLESIGKAVGEDELARYSGLTSPRRQKLSESKMKVCNNTHKLVQELMSDFLNFTTQNRKATLLKTVHEKLAKIRQGFVKLKINNSIEIIDGCINFISHHLIRNPHTTEDSSINLFADIISSLEFYLETLKFTVKPSEQILEFAENSLLQLNRQQ